MEISEIIKLPVCYEDAERGKCHESLLRSYQILQKVRYYLEIETPQEVILEIIHHIEQEADTRGGR